MHFEPNPTDCNSISGRREWAHNEQITEDVEVGANSQEGLVEMNVDGNMKKGVRVEVNKVKPVELEKPPEEGAAG